MVACQYGGECTPESVFYEYEAYFVNFTTSPDYEGIDDHPDVEGIWIQPPNRTVANISCACHESRLGDQCQICEYTS